MVETLGDFVLLSNVRAWHYIRTKNQTTPKPMNTDQVQQKIFLKHVYTMSTVTVKNNPKSGNS